MTYDNFSIKPYTIRSYREFTLALSDSMPADFPFLSIDTDSYIVSATIQSGLDLDIESKRHCLAIGKMCALADSITFLIDLNHNFRSVVQGVPAFLYHTNINHFSKRKGTIILQNDVWVGHGATSMSGVTLHNGCVIAANAVVTKDVPPYTIVGGNPAKVLDYRFDKDTINGLQKIAWWDWPLQVQFERKDDFTLPAPLFVEKYLPKTSFTKTKQHSLIAYPEKNTVLLIPDVNSPHPLYPKILEQYFGKDRPCSELLIYLPEEDFIENNIAKINSFIQQHENCDSYVSLQTGITLDEHLLFQCADFYITTRDRKTVHRTCLADLYNAKILYGTDDPIFPSEL